MLTAEAPVDVQTGFYVSVKDRGRTGLLLGPFYDRITAEANVPLGRRLARQVDADAHWFAYGTAKVETPSLPTGRLNALAGMPQ